VTFPQGLEVFGIHSSRKVKAFQNELQFSRPSLQTFKQKRLLTSAVFQVDLARKSPGNRNIDELPSTKTISSSTICNDLFFKCCLIALTVDMQKVETLPPADFQVNISA
jgi:hypothetical protein